MTNTQLATRVVRHAASEMGGWSNQYLVSDGDEALLYDAPQLRSDARKLADSIAESDLELTTVWISHAHPDHFLGLDVIADRYPEARILSTPNVVADIEADGPWMFDLLSGKLGPEAPARLVVPTAHAGAVVVGDSALEVVEFGPGEAKHHACLHLPANKAFITSDIVYHGAHLYLQEHNADGWRARLDELETVLADRDVETVYPGHGPAGDPSLLAVTRAYLDAFDEAVALGAPEAAQTSLLSRYPEYHAPQFLTMFSIPAYFPAPESA